MNMIFLLHFPLLTFKGLMKCTFEILADSFNFHNNVGIGIGPNVVKIRWHKERYSV